TTVGQTSEGMGASQSTAYKSEIHVKLVGKDQRDDNSFVYAAKIRKQLENVLVGAKIKTVPMGLMGAEQAPISLTVTGSNLDDVMAFAEKAANELRKISGSAGVKLTSEAGNPEIK